VGTATATATPAAIMASGGLAAGGGGGGFSFVSRPQAALFAARGEIRRRLGLAGSLGLTLEDLLQQRGL